VKSHEVHPHDFDGFVREFTFSDGTVWRTCKVPGCRYNTGPGKDPAVICKTHTKDQHDVLPELDGILAPEFEDTAEPLSEITVDGWINAGERASTPEVEEPGDDLDGKYEVEDSDTDEASDDETESASAEI
jgi:hypothetical protein